MTPATGVSLAVLSLDGVDKKPVLSRLEALLAEHGLSSQRTSWQRQLAQAGPDPTGYPTGDLDAAWVDVFHVFFGDATVNGQPMTLPTSYQDVADTGLMTALRTAEVSGIRPSSPLATAWIELAAHTVLHHDVVAPLKQDQVVIQESLGFKNVIKSLLMAEFLDPAQHEAFADMRRFVHRYFASTLAADVGLFLDAEPAALLARPGGRDISAFDSCQLFGGDRYETFLQLQNACRAEFGEFARERGWLRIDCTDPDGAGLDETVRHAVDRIISVRESVAQSVAQ